MHGYTLIPTTASSPGVAARQLHFEARSTDELPTLVPDAFAEFGFGLTRPEWVEVTDTTCEVLYTPSTRMATDTAEGGAVATYDLVVETG